MYDLEIEAAINEGLKRKLREEFEIEAAINKGLKRECKEKLKITNDNIYIKNILGR